MRRRQTGSSEARIRPPSAAAPESRRNTRFAVTLPVRCKRLSARPARTWSGCTADVGSGGFAVELPTRLPPGTPLAVEVRTGIGPLRLEAEVLWTRCVAGRVGIIRHGLCLADRSEILELPIGILLGRWLQDVATRQGKRRGGADAPAPTQKQGRNR
jgi:PilZ domain